MRDADIDLYIGTLRKLGLILHRTWHQMLHKPVIGAAFVGRHYCLASNFSRDSGLYEVSYYVVDVATKLPLSVGSTRAEALDMARRLLRKHAPRVWTAFSEMAEDVKQYEQETQRQREAWLAQRRAELPEPVKSIPKRRLKIFEASEGKCHYCGTVLTLDGRWHIEHKMPKALMGGNEPGNLVASCVTCNHRKKDKTDVEFKAQLAKEAK